jgi:hypothetical protein
MSTELRPDVCSVCGDDDAGARLGVGQGLMVIEVDAEELAHVRQLRRVELPGAASELHGAEELKPRSPNAGPAAARFEHVTVE